MFQILNLIYWIQSSITNPSHEISTVVQILNDDELFTWLNQIKIKKDLNAEENKNFEELNACFRSYNASYIELTDKISEFYLLVNENPILNTQSPTDVKSTEKSQFVKVCLASYSEILDIAKINEDHRQYIIKMIFSDIFKNIFDIFELNAIVNFIKNKHCIVFNKRNEVVNLIKQLLAELGVTKDE